MTSTYDVIVVGAGIVGVACAHYLSLEGLKVLVLDREGIGLGSTAAGMGHVVVMDDSEEQFALTKRSQELWEEVYPELPAKCELLRCGTLWIAADEEEMAAVHAKHDYYSSRGVRTEVLDAKEVQEAEPTLRPDMVGALRVPGDSVIYQVAAAAYFLRAAESRGATFRQAEVHSVQGSTVKLKDGTELSAGAVVNAAGGWGGAITPGLPIEPRKGHLAITDRYPRFVNHQLVELGYLKSAHSMGSESVAFNVQPRATGQLLIGSSRQFVGWEGGVDRRVLAMMLERALQHMPSLASLNTIRTWIGFRAATPDKLPLVGPWPAQPGLFIAAGHEGLGITTSTATGEMIADMVMGRQSRLNVSAFRPDRVMHG